MASETAQPSEIVVPISSSADIVSARQQGRALAARLGFMASDQTVIATAISELARNIIEYAQTGWITLSVAQKGSRIGVVILARDEGPGIPDLPRAMQQGYTTGNGLGLGLPGVKRLMDEMEVATTVGRGTSVTARKWLA
jgi:serine/threonine-protein kinase RsbT